MCSGTVTFYIAGDAQGIRGRNLLSFGDDALEIRRNPLESAEIRRNPPKSEAVARKSIVKIFFALRAPVSDGSLVTNTVVV